MHSAPYRPGNKTIDFEKQEIEEMLAINVFELSQTKAVSTIMLCQRKWPVSLLRTTSRAEHSESTGWVTGNAHGRVYQLEASGYNIFDFWRKKRIFADRNCRAGSRRNGIHLPPQLISLFTNFIWAKNASGTFQPGMGVLPTNEKWQFALVYIDDIFLFSRTQEEHIEHVWHVPTLLNDAVVTRNLKIGTLY